MCYPGACRALLGPDGRGARPHTGADRASGCSGVPPLRGQRDRPADLHNRDSDHNVDGGFCISASRNPRRFRRPDGRLALDLVFRHWLIIQQMRDDDRTGLDLPEPAGFAAMGIFLFFGAVMASLAATTLVWLRSPRISFEEIQQGHNR